jgi:RecB family exonuclease
VFGRYERLGRTGKRVLWELERRRLLRMLERERVEDERRVATTGRRPLVVEHVFGIGDAPAVTVQIGSRPVAFRGRIDRIDTVPASGLAVVDYKTGRADEFRRLRDDPVDRGRHLQLPIYAFAAQAAYPAAAADGITAAFRFVGQGSEEVEFVLDAAGSARFEEALGTILDQITAGLFPYHPGANGENCRFCDFDGLCPSSRASNWERARRAPGLAGYVALAEPESSDA